jgi:hypothetical protein
MRSADCGMRNKDLSGVVLLIFRTPQSEFRTLIANP